MTLPQIRASLSAEDTESVGEELARSILNDPSLPRFVALFGDLGVGKTAFVRGFTKQIAPTARVKSPTFALVNEYKGALCSVFHFDMYRIEEAVRIPLHLDVDGHRADLTLIKSAVAYAAMQGRTEVLPTDVAHVAPLVMAHRMRRNPFQDSRLDAKELESWIQSKMNQ